ncbi:hypothetical protein [Streptomyces sp.]|uniref:hypothetical protein n=1 Tax=Streptomyces sp. TaxID=1931 RepID=UPI002D77052C|nr:hypothetical protein [Streptomyces sp.]HET6360230.1 hypothetical protein [Streptomyces sp.]
MSFEEEWAAASVQANASVSMRLNQVDDGNGGRGGPGTRLHVDSDVLEGRASAADKVLRSFVAADDKATKETKEVGGSLKGFKSAEAFGVFQTRWESQMSYVRGLIHEKVAGALRGAAVDFRTEEKERALKMKGIRDGKGDKPAEPSVKG